MSADEKDDLLWLCERLSSKSDYFDLVTNDMQRLHGILGGILADGRITEPELDGLSGWLLEHEHLKACWPFDEIESLVTAVMRDGKIDEDEQALLLAFFSQFTPLESGRTVTECLWSKENSIRGICALSPEIEFEDRLFCFTGASSKYQRSDLKEIVSRLGGRLSNGVTKACDYLVIGAEGNPCWAYACYGRKVEAAVNLRKKGHKILLVHELDFHDAVRDHEG